jgi:tetratricopeptide (TPR) repeat protein
VVEGWCYDGEGAPAYWPWMQVVRELTAGIAPLELREALGPGGAELAQLVPELRARLPDLQAAADADGEAGRFRLLDDLARLLVHAARKRPTLIVLDDLHWADRSSLRALAFVSREIERAPLLIVGTYRDDEISSAHPLLETLGQLARSTREQPLHLRGLEPDDLAQLARELSGESPSTELVCLLAERTGGNPLFAQELVRWLMEAGPLSDPAALERSARALPASVEGVIRSRLARLSSACQAALEVGCLIGREFRLELLQEASGADVSELLDALDEGVQGGVLRELPGAAGGWEFAHVLMQDAVRARLSRSERVRLHRAIATALEKLRAADLDAVAGELSEHWGAVARAGGSPREAVDYAGRAGQLALAKLAYDEAAAHFERALQALELMDEDGGALRPRLLLELGRARASGGDTSGALAAAEAAAALGRRAGDRVILAEAALVCFARGPAGDRDYQRVLKLLEEAERALREAEDPLCARVQARFAHALLFTPATGPRRHELCESALRIARRYDDPGTLGWVIYCLLFANWSQRSLEERLALTDEMMQIAERLDDVSAPIVASPLHLTCLLEVGDVAAADAEIERLGRRIESLEVPAFYRWYLPLYRGMRALSCGRLAEAERLIPEALALGRRANAYDAERSFAAQLAALRVEQGRFAEIEETVRVAAERYSLDPVLTASYAYVLAELGKLDRARELFEQSAEVGFYDPAWATNPKVLLTLLANVAALLQDGERAALLYQRLLPFRGQLIVNVMAWTLQGAVEWPLGLLARTVGREREAVEHFERALERNGELGLRPFLVRTQLDYARLLLDRADSGDVERARELATASLATSCDADLPHLESRARELLHEALGVRSLSPPREA